MESENRRKYYRARIDLPISWEVLDENEASVVKKGLGSSLLRKESCPSPVDEFLAQALPGSQEERLFRCIQLLNNKLDFIIERLLTGLDKDSGPLDDVVEISGSGLKFTTEESIKEGRFLRMNLVMPETFHYRMEFVAEVLRVEKYRSRFLVASRIVAIDEDTRDAIIQTVFKKQRQEIRMERDSQNIP
jgi:hypothetical protein